MDQMALLVNHDVSIVSVFDLQDVADNTVSRKTLDKVQACLLELH